MDFKMKFKLDDKMFKIIVIAGIACIALIFLSGMFSEKNKEPSEAVDEALAITATEEYEKKLEAEVYELLKSIEGVGEAKVMITLSSGIEYVYATEDSINSDKTSAQKETVEERLQTSKKTIIIEDENGRRKALLKKTLEPAIKGAVIVCEGGDDIIVQERVTAAVKAILGVSSSKICVTKLV